MPENELDLRNSVRSSAVTSVANEGQVELSELRDRRSGWQVTGGGRYRGGRRRRGGRRVA